MDDNSDHNGIPAAIHVDDWNDDDAAEVSSHLMMEDEEPYIQDMILDLGENMLDNLRDSRLTHLELEDGCCSDWFLRGIRERVEEFFQAMRQNTSVHQVSVSGEFLKEMTTLWEESAAASHHQADNDEDVAVSFDWMLLDAISQLPALKTLIVQEVIDFDGYRMPVDYLQHVLHQAKRLETLTLRFVELANPSEQNDLDASLTYLLPHREDENTVANRTLFQAFRNHAALRELTLTQLRLEEGISLNSLIRGIATIPNLQTVKLHMSVQRQQERRHIRVLDDNNDENNTNNNRHSAQHTASLKPLAQQCESLQVLELSSLCMRDEAEFLQALQRHKSLKTLSLAHAELSFSGWAALAHMMQTQRHELHLESLHLDHMSGLDNDTLKLCSGALGGGTASSSLRDLRLLNVMDMGRVGWKAIADMIASNQSLQSLSLENCQGMDDDAVTGIVNALQHNTTLRKLELQVFAGHCTRFSQKVGQKAFVELLRSGRNITLVNLYTQASGDLEAQLECYLNLNRTGLRPFVLQKELPPNAGASDFWNLLQQYNNDLDILFYVLTTNPPFVISCLRGL